MSVKRAVAAFSAMVGAAMAFQLAVSLLGSMALLEMRRYCVRQGIIDFILAMASVFLAAYLMDLSERLHRRFDARTSRRLHAMEAITSVVPLLLVFFLWNRVEPLMRAIRPILVFLC